MDFALSEEQEMLKTMARDFMTNKFPKATVRELEESEPGYSPAIWKEMTKLGWLGLVFPEQYGGEGRTFLDLAVLLEEMGAACLPGPYFSTIILGGLPIVDIGSEEQKRQYLPKIASGELLFTLALTEPSARYDAASIKLNASADKDNYILNGTKLFVPDAHIADYMLVVARTSSGIKAEDGITIFIINAKRPGISHTLLKTIANDKLCELVFDKVNVPKEGILGKLNDGWGEVQKTLQRASVARCCEMVGAMQRVLNMTVDYAKIRVQYGRPIGSFQAIQHYCANMAVDVDGLRLAAYNAAWMINEGLPCAREVAMAKVWTGEACRRVMSLAHQIHGAVGFTMEHDLQFYLRRAKAAEVTFGDADFYIDFLASSIGL